MKIFGFSIEKELTGWYFTFTYQGMPHIYYAPTLKELFIKVFII